MFGRHVKRLYCLCGAQKCYRKTFVLRAFDPAFLEYPDFFSCLYIVLVTISSTPVFPLTCFPAWRPDLNGTGCASVSKGQVSWLVPGVMGTQPAGSSPGLPMVIPARSLVLSLPPSIHLHLGFWFILKIQAIFMPLGLQRRYSFYSVGLC